MIENAVEIIGADVTDLTERPNGGLLDAGADNILYMADDSGLFCSKCNKAIPQSVASCSQGKFGAMLCIDCQKEAAGK